MLNKNTLPKLPNLRDGLALSYAAANKGNNKAATKAREAAYTESEPPLKDTGTKLLSTEFPKLEKTVRKTNAKPEFTNLLGNPNEKASVGTVAGIVMGILIGYATEEVNINGKSAKEWADTFADWAIDGIKNGLIKKECFK